MDNIPSEILIHVISFLDIKSILHCSRINKNWYNISNTDCIWKRFCNGKEYLTEYEDSKDEHNTLKPMCYYKWYYINYVRITNNWMGKKYKSHKIPMNGVSGNYKMATYSDNSLIVCFTATVRVYRIIKGDLFDFQTFSIPEGMLLLLNSICTNNTYIVLNCGKVVAVYKLVDHYEEVCMFYQNIDSSFLQHNAINEDNFATKITKSFFSGNVCSINSVLHGDFLYTFVQKVIFIWDLRKMVCLLKIEAISFLTAQDKKRIFICPDHHIINVYSKSSHVLLSLKVNWNIHQIETNQNILLALESENFTMDDNGLKKIGAWNKYSGDKIYETSIEVADFCFLHPKWDVLLGNICSGDNICAIQPENGFLLWFRETKRQDNPFSDRLHAIGFRSMAGDRFIIATIDSSTCYHVIDSKNGNTLYTLNNSEVKYIGFDVLLLADSFRKNIFIQIYS